MTAPSTPCDSRPGPDWPTAYQDTPRRQPGLPTLGIADAGGDTLGVLIPSRRDGLTVFFFFFCWPAVWAGTSSAKVHPVHVGMRNTSLDGYGSLMFDQRQPPSRSAGHLVSPRHPIPSVSLPWDNDHHDAKGSASRRLGVDGQDSSVSVFFVPLILFLWRLRRPIDVSTAGPLFPLPSGAESYKAA